MYHFSLKIRVFTTNICIIMYMYKRLMYCFIVIAIIICYKFEENNILYLVV